MQNSSLFSNAAGMALSVGTSSDRSVSVFGARSDNLPLSLGKCFDCDSAAGGQPLAGLRPDFFLRSAADGQTNVASLERERFPVF